MMPDLNTWLLLFISALTAWTVKQGRENLITLIDAQKKIAKTQSDMALLEKNTNSIQAALNISKEEAGFGKGVAAERASQEAKKE